MKQIFTLILIVFVVNFGAAQKIKIQDNSLKPLKIGQEYDVDVQTQHPYSLQESGNSFSHEFKSKNATYVKIHFSNFDLANGDVLYLIDARTNDTVQYDGKGKVIDRKGTRISTFWSRAMFTDHVILSLQTTNHNHNKFGFAIDQVAYGYTREEMQNIPELADDIETVCGNDDREQIACYEGDETFRKGNAVARLLINGSGLCTAWLLGSEGHVMTNNHCIGNNTEANNTDFLFNYQNTDCAGTTQATPDLVADASILIQTNGGLDYTLVELPVNPTNNYGFLSFRSTPPTVAERIYIPQHPGGRRKEISILDDQSQSGYAEVTASSPARVEYRSDTEGGSSGSPVLSYDDNLVVALHNTGTGGSCPQNGNYNGGNRNQEIIASLGNNMPIDGVDNNNPPGPIVSIGTQEIVVQEQTDCDNNLQVQIPIRLATAATQAVDVELILLNTNATENYDYLISNNTVTYALGENGTKMMNLEIINDSFGEQNEQIEFEIQINANGGDATLNNERKLVTISIEDDDIADANFVENEIFVDDFETDLSQWVVTGDPSPTNFALGNLSSASSVSWNISGNATQFAFVNDDDCDCDMSQERITIGNNYDFTSYNALRLEMDYSYFETTNFASDFFLQASLDDGSSWSNLGNELATTERSFNSTIVDLSSLLTQNSVRLSFLYNDLGNWAYGAAIDNVKLVAEAQTAIATNITNTPISLNVNGSGEAHALQNQSIISSLSINQSTNFGCTTINIVQEGNGGFLFNSTNNEDLAVEKVVEISTTNDPESSATNQVSLYFTEAELAGWENQVGANGGTYTRNDLVMVRDGNINIANFSDLEVTEYSTITIENFGNGHKVSGNFTSIKGTFFLVPQSLLSVKDVDSNQQKSISLYPNPSKNKFYFNLTTNEKIKQINLYNAAGKLVLNQIGYQDNSGVNVAKLPKGMYIVEVLLDNNNTKTLKLLKE